MKNSTKKQRTLACYRNTANEYYTLDEYKTKVETLQKDKDGTLVYLYTNNLAKQDAFIQSAKNKSYDVLLMDSPLDSHLIGQLEHKLEKTAWKRVDADVIDKLIDKGDSIAHVLTEDETTKVKQVFEKAINKPAMTVEVESLSPDELPVTITMNEFMRRMKDMAAMGGGGPMNFYGSLCPTITK
jgi:molecular chaperone HtpG